MGHSAQYITDSNEHYYTSIISQQLKEELRNKYSTGKRHYHTWQHIKDLFGLLELVDSDLECLPAVILAILFHDAVYDPRRTDNELRSSLLLRKKCSKLDPYWVERAEVLILATQDHKLPATEPEQGDLAYFLDLDLAVLGGSPEQYNTYASQVRQEYSYLADDVYAARRASFLKTLLARLQTETLYHTQWAKKYFAAPAAANIQAEIDLLENGNGKSTPLSLEG